MRVLGAFIRRRPRLAAALAFGIPTTVLIHFAWYADARMSGIIPALTLGIGLTHALVGALTGPRLVSATRTRTSSQAVLLGAGISLIALALFVPLLSVYIFAMDALETSALGVMVFTFLTGLFAFLAAGWALLLLSAAIGWSLYRLASSAAAAESASETNP